MARWEKAMSEGALLGAQTWARAMEPGNFNNGRGMFYAGGWLLGFLKKKRVFEHAGGIPGFSSFALRMPEEGIYVAVLSNDDGGVEGLWTLLRALLFGPPHPGALARRLASRALEC
jgi:CubicO group peptidase (beta-lactamase class C family)